MLVAAGESPEPIAAMGTPCGPIAAGLGVAAPAANSPIGPNSRGNDLPSDTSLGRRSPGNASVAKGAATTGCVEMGAELCWTGTRGSLAGSCRIPRKYQSIRLQKKKKAPKMMSVRT